MLIHWIMSPLLLQQCCSWTASFSLETLHCPGWMLRERGCHWCCWLQTAESLGMKPSTGIACSGDRGEMHWVKEECWAHEKRRASPAFKKSFHLECNSNTADARGPSRTCCRENKGGPSIGVPPRANREPEWVGGAPRTKKDPAAENYRGPGVGGLSRIRKDRFGQ